MREQKILNSVVILVVIVSFSASLWVSWLRAPHGAKSGSTAQMSQSVKMSQSVGREAPLPTRGWGFRSGLCLNSSLPCFRGATTFLPYKDRL